MSPAIDEKRGSAVDAAAHTARKVLPDPFPEAAAFQRVAQRLRVHPVLLCQAEKKLRRKLRLVLENTVMHLPKFVLSA